MRSGTPPGMSPRSRADRRQAAARPPAALDAAIEVYLTYALAERGLARHTVEAYARDLTDFAAFAARRGARGPRDLHRSTLTLYLLALRRRGLAAASVARRFAAVRGGGPRAGGRPGAALSLTRRGGRLTRQSVWTLLRTCARRAGIRKPIHPH